MCVSLCIIYVDVDSCKLFDSSMLVFTGDVMYACCCISVSML